MGRHKGYDRQAVLDKAMELFWKKGFEGTHLQELVDVTGLNRFSLYKEFGGKEGLFEEAVEKYLAGLQGLGAYLMREPLGLDNVLEYLREVIRTDFSYGCFMVNTLTQKHVVQKQITERVRNFAQGSEQALRKNFQAAQEKGEISADLDVKALAKFMLVFDMGLVTYELLSPAMKEKEEIWEILKSLLESPNKSFPSDLARRPAAMGQR
jgi:TetR/AcrR family transcriptional repressor of nem operon